MILSLVVLLELLQNMDEVLSCIARTAANIDEVLSCIARTATNRDDVLS